MKRFKENMETLILSGGRHVLCIPDLLEKNSDGPTPEEILAE